jgi:hypothetical protein
MKAKLDAPLEEIWAIRRKIAKKFGFDPKKQVAYYQHKQKELGAKIYQPEVLTGADVLHDRVHAEIAAGEFTTPSSYRAAGKRKAKRGK